MHHTIFSILLAPVCSSRLFPMIALVFPQFVCQKDIARMVDPLCAAEEVATQQRRTPAHPLLVLVSLCRSLDALVQQPACEALESSRRFRLMHLQQRSAQVVTRSKDLTPIDTLQGIKDSWDSLDLSCRRNEDTDSSTMPPGLLACISRMSTGPVSLLGIPAQTTCRLNGGELLLQLHYCTVND